MERVFTRGIFVGFTNELVAQNGGFRCEKLQQLHRQITRNYSNDRQVSDAKRASRMQFHVRPVGKFCGVANYCNDIQRRNIQGGNLTVLVTATSELLLCSSRGDFFARPYSLFSSICNFITQDGDCHLFPRKRNLSLFVSSYNFPIKSIGVCYFAQ